MQLTDTNVGFEGYCGAALDLNTDVRLVPVVKLQPIFGDTRAHPGLDSVSDHWAVRSVCFQD